MDVGVVLRGGRGRKGGRHSFNLGTLPGLGDAHYFRYITFSVFLL